MKTFEDYYKKHLNKIIKLAKEDKISVEEFIKTHYLISLSEHKERYEKSYTTKNCHSFWHRECENKGIECHHCNHYYSLAEYDKMTKKEKNQIGIS